VKRADLMLFLGFAVIAIGGGLAMDALQPYMNGDWADVKECRETPWVCEVSWSAVARIPQTAPVVFEGTAKACDEYRAYRKAAERARFDCAMSRRVQGSTCAELEQDCTLPNDRY